MNSIWQKFNNVTRLQPSEAHLIAAELSEDPAVSDKYWEILSKAEKARANQFRFAKHRSHFIMARGLLRQILAIYTGVSAKDIEFRYQKMGKPELQNLSTSKLEFNLSHSGSMALYALTLEHNIGVDIEIIKPCNELELAKRFFAKQEYESLLALPETDRRKAFFQIWTLKEAFIKALGTGLFQALDQFSVSAGNGGILTHCQDNDGPIEAWHMQVFDVNNRYQAAFACKNDLKNIRYWAWSDNFSA